MKKITRRLLLMISAITFFAGLIMAPTITIGLVAVGALAFGFLNIAYSVLVKLFRKPMIAATIVVTGYFIAAINNLLSGYFLLLILISPFILFYMMFGLGRNNTNDNSGMEGVIDRRDEYNPGGLTEMVDSDDFILYGVDARENGDDP